MFSGNEWVIVIVVMGVMVVPVLIIAAIALGARRRRTDETHAAPSVVPNASQHGPALGWYPDPTGRHAQRYWDGSTWTDAVVSNGQPATDPL